MWWIKKKYIEDFRSSGLDSVLFVEQCSIVSYSFAYNIAVRMDEIMLC